MVVPTPPLPEMKGETMRESQPVMVKRCVTIFLLGVITACIWSVILSGRNSGGQRLQAIQSAAIDPVPVDVQTNTPAPRFEIVIKADTPLKDLLPMPPRAVASAP